MSAAEKLPEPQPVPPPLTEEERHRAEDPNFPVIHAKAIALARGEKYEPAKHMVRTRKKRFEVPPEHDEALGAIIERFMAKASRRPRLHVDRPDTERSGFR